MGAARRGLATLPGHEASRRLRAIGYHDGLEAREPKQTKQHGEELAAASILHTPIVIGPRSHPKWSPDQPRVANRAARLLRSHQVKVLSSMKKQPAHTNHCGFCAVAARCAKMPKCGLNENVELTSGKLHTYSRTRADRVLRRSRQGMRQGHGGQRRPGEADPHRLHVGVVAM